MGTKSNFVQGVVVQFDSIKKFSTITRELTLQELIELKQATVNKIKSLVGNLTSRPDPAFEFIEKNINLIEALQYNLTIFKQLNAIANVGSPEKNMLGINGCIYQSSDLSTLNSVLQKVITLQLHKSDSFNVRKYLFNKIKENRHIIDNHYRAQTQYNKSMKIRVEYLDIKL